jgi:regulator of sigma E protease
MPIYTVLGFVIMFGLLVSVHEWGHYYAARRQGIHATTFSIGFGPVLWSRVDARGTRWQLCAFLIGGYVKFLGDKDGSSASASPELRQEAETLSEAERRRRFHLRGPGARALVIAAGPATNLILGVALLAGLYVGIGRPSVPAVISQVVAGEPAELAGVRPGDRVVTVNGHPPRTFSDVHDEIALYPGALVRLVLERTEDGATRQLGVDVQSKVGVVEAFGAKQTVGRIGIISGRTTVERMGPIDAVVAGVGDVYKQTKTTFVALGQIVSGARPLADMGGPIKMAETSGQALQAGFAVYVFYVAVISINLGVLNLLPIPVLDGAALLFCAVEAVIRRPVSNRILGYAHMAGGAALLLLMVVVSASDVYGIVQKLML